MHPQLEAIPETAAPKGQSQSKPDQAPEPNIVHLLAVPMRAEAVLGTLRMKVGAISALQVGAILRTQRSSLEPLDLTVNSTLVAAAEVCPQGERLGLRIIELHADD
jgi:flagellar motor switch/type III secretory pathway protein FliN